MKIPVPLKPNQHGKLCVDWSHWSVRLRIWLYYKVAEPYLPHKITFFMYMRDIVLDGEPEDCWVGGWELGPND